MSTLDVTPLVDVLVSEEELYRELLALLQRERELMVDLDADGLGEVARQKEILTAEGRLLERGRVEVADRLARALSIPPDRVTLAEICAALGPAGDPLRAAHARLVALLGAVRELVEANRVMGGDRLAFVQGTLSLLGGMLPGHVGEPQGYRRDGVVPESSTPGGHLVRRSV